MKAQLVPKLEIRDTTFEDIPKFRAMHGASWRDTYPSPENGVSYEWVKERTASWVTPEGIEKSKEHFKNILGKSNHLHKVAVMNGEIIGILHVFRKEVGGYHLAALYVATPYHGTGVAQQLMDIALKWCDPAEPIDLDVAVYNERAKAFYAKYEFLEKPGTEQLFADTIPVVTMEREGANNEI